MKKTTAFLLILFNLAVAVAPHIGHADEWVNPGQADILRSHDCGAHEIHKDIKDHGDCLLCSRTTLFVAFVVYGQLSRETNIEVLPVFVHRPVPSFAFIPTIFQRGPPAILS
jgi:hypothetical protein